MVVHDIVNSGMRLKDRVYSVFVPFYLTTGQREENLKRRMLSEHKTQIAWMKEHDNIDGKLKSRNSRLWQNGEGICPLVLC